MQFPRWRRWNIKVVVRIWNRDHFKFMSWISKSFRNGPSALRNCLQMTITSLFHLWFAHCLKRWTSNFPSLKKYIVGLKWTLRSASNFASKSEYMLPPDFEFQIFMQLDEFISCLIIHVCLPSFLLHNGHLWSPKLMISSFFLSSYSMSLDLFISPVNPFLIFQNLKWFNLHHFLPLNLR